MKEATLYEKLDANRVHCYLCSQHCRIESGQRGQCGVRENRDGRLISLVYNRLIAQSIDPIEKKPLFHFYPGSRSYSIATVGCNLSCLFCQNSDISQSPRESKIIYGQEIPAQEVVDQAKRAQCASISYTYTEPTIFMEYALDVAPRAHEAGITNVFVSNGYMSEEALDTIAPHLDAANVDLKAFRDEYYSKQCGAHLKPVLQTLERMVKRGVWLEVTTLIIPGLNDDPQELKELAGFLVSLSPDIPWHVSRFYPTYKMLDRPPTSVKTVQTARQIGLDAGLRYVYTGNVSGDDGENTFCHNCGALLIEREGYSIKKRGLKDSACSACGSVLAGVGL